MTGVDVVGRTRDGAGYGATVRNRSEGPSAAGNLGATPGRGRMVTLATIATSLEAAPMSGAPRTCIVEGDLIEREAFYRLACDPQRSVVVEATPRMKSTRSARQKSSTSGAQ